MSRVLLAALLMHWVIFAAAGTSDSTSAGPCGVFEGKLRTLEVYGPPNYGESPDTDSRLTVSILDLLSPIRGAKVWDVYRNEHTVPYVEQVQIVGSPSSTRQSESVQKQGTRRFSGCLFYAESGHHVTEVILDTGAKY